MPQFPDIVKLALAKRERELVLVVKVVLKRADPNITQSFTAVLAGGAGTIRDGIASNTNWGGGSLSGDGLDPIVLSVGRHLLGQDYDTFGDGTTKGEVVLRDIAPGRASAMSQVLSEGIPETLSDVMDQGWLPIGQYVTLYLYEMSLSGMSGNDNHAEIIGRYTCTGVTFGRGTVHLTVSDEKPWNRQVPLTRLVAADMGEDWTRPLNTPHAGQPIPFHFGYRGRQRRSWSVSGNPETIVNSDFFHGRADPWNPAPCVVIEPSLQHPTNGEEGWMLFGAHETGRLSNVPWDSWQNDGVFLWVDGRFAYLGALGSAALEPYTRTIKNPNTGAENFDVLAFTLDPDATRAFIPIFPTKDAGTENNWDDYLNDINPALGDSSVIFNGDLRTGCGLLNLTSDSTWIRKFQDLGTYTNLGPVYGLEGFAIVTVQGGGIADFRMSLYLDDSTLLDVDSLSVYGNEAQTLLTFDLTSALTTHADVISEWRYEYQETTVSTSLPMRLGIAAKKNGSSAITPNVVFHSVGLTVEFTPNAIRDAAGYTSSNILATGGPAFPGNITLPAIKTISEPKHVDVYLAGAAQKDATSGIYSGDPSAPITNPVGMLWYTLSEKVFASNYIAAPTPSQATDDANGGHGQWTLARETLDSLPSVLIGTNPPQGDYWEGSYTVDEYKDGAWDVAREFMAHLPLCVWKDRTHQMRCSIWYPDKIQGLSWGPPVEYMYPVPLDPSHVKHVKSVSVSPVDRVYNEIIIDWDYHEGHRRYMTQAMLNRDACDDGLGMDWSSDHYKEMAQASEDICGRRTLTVKARTVHRFQEAACLLMYYMRKHARRHIELEVELDISCADIEPMQFAYFGDDTMPLRWGRDTIPLLGVPWSNHWFRVTRRFVDYDKQTVTVSLRSTFGAF